MEYRELITNPETRDTWMSSAANEFNRLAKGTNTIKFIRHNDVPKGRMPTYGRFVCDIRPQKTETHRTRLTVGGNLISYPGVVSTKTADITTAKCLFNSVVSTPNARFACFDIKNFYLNTPLDRPEYMKIPIALIPDAIIKDYNLQDKVYNGFIYVEINKGMYGLPQAGLLANKLLQRRLAKFGYYPTRFTPGLWKHAYRPIQFALVVDDFGIEYVGQEHADHLKAALLRTYELSVDWDGKIFCGVHLNWDYGNRTVELSVPGYTQSVLAKFQHTAPTRPQHAPHKAPIKQYGVKVQLTPPPDMSVKLTPAACKRIQRVLGCLLWYGRVVDLTQLVALSALAAEQAQATETTEKAITQLLDYCHTHPDAILRYSASDMKLEIHSDASYLTETKARSRVGGHHYLTNNNPRHDFNNGSILNPTGIMNNVMSSAAEAETGAVFHNMKEGVVIRTTLEEMGWPQGRTRIQTDNSTAMGIANSNINQRRSKAMDMRFFWIQDREAQQQFKVEWEPAALNKADYFTKHHPPSHHINMRPIYLHIPAGPSAHALRGCVDLTAPPCARDHENQSSKRGRARETRTTQGYVRTPEQEHPLQAERASRIGKDNPLTTPSMYNILHGRHTAAHDLAARDTSTMQDINTGMALPLNGCYSNEQRQAGQPPVEATSWQATRKNTEKQYREPSHVTII